MRAEKCLPHWMFANTVGCILNRDTNVPVNRHMVKQAALVEDRQCPTFDA